MSSASNSQSENGPSATDPSLQQHSARSGQEQPPAAAAQISISQTCSQQAADQPSTAVGRAARGSLPPPGVQQSPDPQVWRSADPQVWPSLGSRPRPNTSSHGFPHQRQQRCEALAGEAELWPSQPRPQQLLDSPQYESAGYSPYLAAEPHQYSYVHGNTNINPNAFVFDPRMGDPSRANTDPRGEPMRKFFGHPGTPDQSTLHPRQTSHPNTFMDQEAGVERETRMHYPPSQPMTGPPMTRPRQAQVRPDPHPFQMPQEWGQHQAGPFTPPGHQTNQGRVQAVFTQEYANNLEYQAFLVRAQLAKQAREGYTYPPMQTQMQERGQVYNDLGAEQSANRIARNPQAATQNQPWLSPRVMAARRDLEQTTINMRMVQSQLALEQTRHGGVTAHQQLSFQEAQRQVIEATNALQLAEHTDATNAAHYMSQQERHQYHRQSAEGKGSEQGSDRGSQSGSVSPRTIGSYPETDSNPGFVWDYTIQRQPLQPPQPPMPQP